MNSSLALINHRCILLSPEWDHNLRMCKISCLVPAAAVNYNWGWLLRIPLKRKWLSTNRSPFKQLLWNYSSNNQILNCFSCQRNKVTCFYCPAACIIQKISSHTCYGFLYVLQTSLIGLQVFYLSLPVVIYLPASICVIVLDINICLKNVGKDVYTLISIYYSSLNRTYQKKKKNQGQENEIRTLQYVPQL